MVKINFPFHLKNNIFNGINIINNLINDHRIGILININKVSRGVIDFIIIFRDGKINFIDLMLKKLGKVLDINRLWNRNIFISLFI
jgi:hypothetical protein